LTLFYILLLFCRIRPNILELYFLFINFIFRLFILYICQFLTIIIIYMAFIRFWRSLLRWCCSTFYRNIIIITWYKIIILSICFSLSDSSLWSTFTNLIIIFTINIFIFIGLLLFLNTIVKYFIILSNI